MAVFTAIATAVVGALGLTGVAATVTAFLVRTLAVAVVSSLIGRAFSPNKTSASQESGSRVQLPPATNNKLPIVYGAAYMSPIIFDAKLSQDQKFMWYVGAISEVSDTGLMSFDDPSIPTPTPLVYWGDRKLVFDSSDKTRVVSSTGPNGDSISYASDEFRVYFYRDGSNNPTYGAPLATTVLSDSSTGGGIPAPQRWTSANTMYKTAFMIVRIKYNSDKSLTGLQQLTTRAYNSLNSPGDVLVDYLTNTRYGCAMPMSAVDTAAFDRLDTYSQQTISYITSGGSTATQARYQINGPVDTTQNCFDNLKNLTDACDTWLQWNEAQGQWSVVINQSITQSGLTPANLFVINSNNIIGGIDITPLDIAATYNRLEVSFPSKLIKDQTDYAYVNLSDYNTNNRYQLSPNEPVNSVNLQLPQVNDSVQAQYIGVRRLLQSRDDLIITVKLDYSGIQVNAGDVVRVYQEYYGWDTLNNGNGKYFRVTQVQEYLTEDGILGASLSLIEYNDSVYDDNAIRAFAPAANTGILNPQVLLQPSAPTITSVNPTSTAPSFQVNAVTPGSSGTPDGQVQAIEFWYSTSQDIVGNNYILWDTQYYSGGALYPYNTAESIVVSGIPAGVYYWRVRTSGPSGTKSDYSSASAALTWNPSPTATVTGQNFQGVFSPAIQQVPRTNTGTITFTGIQPQLYGISGAQQINYVDANGDSNVNFVNNSWRIGASSTGYLNDIVKTNITIGNPTDGGNYAQFPQPTGMTGSATIQVPIRYKDSTGNVFQSPVASLQLTFNDQGANGAAGNNGFTTIVNRIYVIAPSTVSSNQIVTTGGVWNIATGTWQTRPTTTVNNVVTTNYDTPQSFTNTQIRWVISSTASVTQLTSGTITPAWLAAQIDSGYGPAGADGTSPVDLQINLGGGGFYKAVTGDFSPQNLTVSGTIQNYPAPVPQIQWSVTGATPITGTGSSITITPLTNTQSITVSAQVGPYVKNVVIPVINQGATGPAGAQGVPGTAGTRGFNPIVYIPVNFDPSTASNTQRTQAYTSQTGYPPIEGDGAAFFWTGAGAPVPNVSYAYKYVASSGSWIQFEYYIPGDLIAAGTIRAVGLSTFDIFTNRLSSIGAQFGQNTGNGFWLDSGGGNAYFGGSMYVGNNLTVGNLIQASALNANTVATTQLQLNAVTAPIQSIQPSGPIYFTTPPAVNTPYEVSRLDNVTIGAGETVIIVATAAYTIDLTWTATTGNRFIQIEDALNIGVSGQPQFLLTRGQINISRVDFSNNTFTRIGQSTHIWTFVNGSGIDQTYSITHTYKLTDTYNSPTWNRYYAEFRGIAVYRSKR